MTDTTGVCKTCSRPLPEGRTSGRCDPCRKQLANNVMRNGAKVGERQESCRLMFTQQSLRRRGADAVRSGGAKCSSAPCSSTTKLRCGAPTSPELGSTRGWG